MNIELWAEACERLERGEALAFATIATNEGSTPRTAGAKLLAGTGGLLQGTLGGGAPEAKALEEAEKILRGGDSVLFTVDMSGSAASGADLICGGRVGIFVRRLGQESLEAVRLVRERLLAGLDSILLTPIHGDAPPLLLAPEDDAADLPPEVGESAGGTRLFPYRGEEYLFEPLAAPSRLILAGGGHVSLATARAAAMVGFDVAVLDDRAEFADPARFPWLHPDRIRIAPAFANCLARETLGFSVGPKCSIAILTRGHSFDSEVLVQALATSAGYIGMIGSRRKRDAVYEALLSRGFARSDLERVHSPIGLSIGAETPEEIAISIVAELVAERAKSGGGL